MIPQSPAAVNARRGRGWGRGMPRRKASCKCQIGGKTEIAGSCAAAVFGQTQSPWHIPNNPAIHDSGFLGRLAVATQCVAYRVFSEDSRTGKG